MALTAENRNAQLEIELRENDEEADVVRLPLGRVGAVRALDPERVVILPEGDEDLWNDDYAELVELA